MDSGELTDEIGDELEDPVGSIGPTSTNLKSSVVRNLTK
jgi:hypothetical protein